MTSYRQAAGRATRRAVVQSTPALEYELLWMLGLRGGATLADVFERDWTWVPDAPTWALLAVTNLLIDGCVLQDAALPAKLVLTDKGRARLGRNHGGQS